MNAEEIKLLLAATEKRIAELKPAEEKLWTAFKALEVDFEKLSLPMLAARKAWSENNNEIDKLIDIRKRYAEVLEQSRKDLTA